MLLPVGFISISSTGPVADPGIWKRGGGGGGLKDIFCLATPTYKALGLLVVISR